MWQRCENEECSGGGTGESERDRNNWRGRARVPTVALLLPPAADGQSVGRLVHIKFFGPKTLGHVIIIIIIISAAAV